MALGGSRLGSMAPSGPPLGSIAGESPNVGCSEQPLEPPLKRANSAIVGGSDLRSRPQAFREDHPIELLITQVHHLKRS